MNSRIIGGALCAFLFAAVASCTSGSASDDLGGVGLASGAGARAGSIGASGAVNGSGGAVNGSGGAVNGSGGAVNGSGGAVNGSGGAVNGSGGAVNGSGGTQSTTGGSATAGVSSGAAAGSGGRSGAGGAHAGGSGGTANGGSTGGSSGSTSGGACTNPPAAIQGGSNAWASRYWDCCKPACGWKGNVKSGNPMKACDASDNVLGSFDTKNACESGGSAFMCWSDSPWAACDTLSYGFAAASAGNYVCGRCFQLQFDGNSHNAGANAGAKSLKGKTMIVQVINNGGVAADQFDLLIPGGGVGILNACSTTTQGITSQWGKNLDLGAQYGGLLAGCNGDKSCVQQKCQSIFAGKPDLQAGCDWFLNWFNAADNPTFTYKQVACPAAITQKSGLSDPG